MDPISIGALASTIGSAAGGAGAAAGSTALGGSILGPLASAINGSELLTGLGTGGLLGGGVTTQGLGAGIGKALGMAGGMALPSMLGAGGGDMPTILPPPGAPQASAPQRVPTDMSRFTIQQPRSILPMSLEEMLRRR